MDMQEPAEEPSRVLLGKKRGASKATRFLAAGGPPIPNVSQRQRPRSRSRSPTRENRNNAISPQKNFATPRLGSGEKASQSQTIRAPLGPRDPNAVSTRSMRNLESSQSSTC